MKYPDQKNKLIEVILYPLPLIVFILLWALLTEGHPQTEFIFSSPSQVFNAFVKLACSGELFRHSAITIL